MALHRFNRRVFFQLDAASPLLRLYTQLVALELYVKERLPSWVRGHDVCTLLQDGTYATDIATLAFQLGQLVASLHCTDRTGLTATVGSQYPNLRYLQHDSDFAHGSSDQDLQQALAVLDDLIEELGDITC